MIIKVVKIILGILLIFSLIGVVFVYSISENVNDNSIGKIINETINSKSNETNTDFGDSYDSLINECEGKESIIIGQGKDSLKFNCLELKSIGKNNFENYFKEKVSGEAQTRLEVNYALIKNWLLILFFASLILTLGIIILDWKGTFVNLGIIYTISGILFIFSGRTKKIMDDILNKKILDAGGNLDYSRAIINLVDKIGDKIFSNFLIIFIIGILFLVVGFSIVIFKKIKKRTVENDN